jgi:hypothetical protein
VLLRPFAGPACHVHDQCAVPPELTLSTAFHKKPTTADILHTVRLGLNYNFSAPIR